jgi:hypothetical protein
MTTLTFNSYVVVEANGETSRYNNVSIRVTNEGCLQILGAAGTLYVTYSSTGWLKCWRVETEQEDSLFR